MQSCRLTRRERLFLDFDSSCRLASRFIYHDNAGGAEGGHVATTTFTLLPSPLTTATTTTTASVEVTTTTSVPCLQECRSWGLGVSTPSENMKICRSQSMFCPLKCHILLFKTVVGLCKIHIIKDERLVKRYCAPVSGAISNTMPLKIFIYHNYQYIE